MSKILLIKPRFPDAINQPLGLMYISASLKKVGHEPKIHDCALDDNDLHMLKNIITDWKPDYIGISIIITDLEQTKKIVGIIRDILPDVVVTFGGPWPSANPEEAIKIYGADFVVLGEGEFVFPELIDAINNGCPTEAIPGTASMVNDQININQGRYLSEDELNALPFPAWELLDHKLYAKKGSHAAVGCRPYMSIITSRGCPYKCAYCCHSMGKVFRKRTAESVLAEMEDLYFKHGFKEFEILDDCFNFDRERMYAILNGIKERLRGVKLHFPNGLRSDRLEPEDMVLFKQAGTVSAVFAIETCSQRLQKMIHRNLNIEKSVCAINASVKEGIYSSGFFMIGFPTETYEEASETVKFAKRSSLHRAQFYVVTTFAGTELEMMTASTFKRKNDNIDARKMPYYNITLNISAMSDDQLKKIFRRAYRSFYLSPKRIFSLIVHFPRFIELPRYAFLVLLRTLSKIHSAALARIMLVLYDQYAFTHYDNMIS